MYLFLFFYDDIFNIYHSISIIWNSYGISTGTTENGFLVVKVHTCEWKVIKKQIQFSVQIMEKKR
ncbi:hypothetical protein DRN76_01900 [Methanosarcinales archaeon]|nr:MAG: hypothetical protein DRN76_01900 [Methanosarcinales archaeon]